jgi:DNA-binding Xre family transcriptional regulator
MTETEINIGLEIRTLIDERGIKIKWLAEQVGCDNSNLGKMLKNNHIYPELLLKISIALKTNFFEQYYKAFLTSINKSNK